MFALMQKPKLSQKDLKEVRKAIESALTGGATDFQQIYSVFGRFEGVLGLFMLGVAIHKTSVDGVDPNDVEKLVWLIFDMLLYTSISGLTLLETYHWCKGPKKTQALTLDTVLPNDIKSTLIPYLQKIRDNDLELEIPLAINTYGDLALVADMLMYQYNVDINIPHLSQLPANKLSLS